MTESNPFDTGGSHPSLSFAKRDEYGNLQSVPVGTKYVGTVVETPKMVQKRNFDTKQPESWPDGNPKMTAVTVLEVNGEKRSLWADKPSALFKAIQDALTDANGVIRAIEVGGTLTIELIGFKAAEAGKAPQKLYKVTYTASNAFGGAAPAATEAAAPVASVDEEARRAALYATLSEEDRALLASSK